VDEPAGNTDIQARLELGSDTPVCEALKVADLAPWRLVQELSAETGVHPSVLEGLGRKTWRRLRKEHDRNRVRNLLRSAMEASANGGRPETALNRNLQNGDGPDAVVTADRIRIVVEKVSALDAAERERVRGALLDALRIVGVPPLAVLVRRRCGRFIRWLRRRLGSLRNRIRIGVDLFRGALRRT
jgi:hypothetical protein